MTDTEVTNLSESEEASAKKSKKHITSGYPISKINFILVAVVSVIALFLLVTTFRVNTGYQKLVDTIESYLQWEQDVKNMEIYSDYLTNEVRAFVETGNVEHLNLYFKEVEENKGRDEALNNIRECFSEQSSVFKTLNAAMNGSLTLEYHEYTSMCLKLESMGKNPLDYNALLVSEEYISPENRMLSPAKKDALARELVFDSYYQQKKDEIRGNVSMCLSLLIEEITKQETESSLTVENTLIIQRFWIILLILFVTTTVVMTSLQVIRPLHKAVPLIRGDKQIPVEGAAEFRLLAYTYNRMYEINREYKEKLRFRANHDQLTGALNRRGIEEMLNGADLKCVALLLIDIDFFKEINDKYGHSMGDRVLSKVSQILQSTFRSEDVICRMGGDEFAVVMWKVEPDTKELIANKIKHINDILRSGTDDLPSVSISVGVAFGGEHSDDIFNRADKALYRVKASGRANCAFFE